MLTPPVIFKGFSRYLFSHWQHLAPDYAGAAVVFCNLCSILWRCREASRTNPRKWTPNLSCPIHCIPAVLVDGVVFFFGAGEVSLFPVENKDLPILLLNESQTLKVRICVHQILEIDLHQEPSWSDVHPSVFFFAPFSVKVFKNHRNICMLRTSANWTSILLPVCWVAVSDCVCCFFRFWSVFSWFFLHKRNIRKPRDIVNLSTTPFWSP